MLKHGSQCRREQNGRLGAFNARTSNRLLSEVWAAMNTGLVEKGQTVSRFSE